eukprot:jgi/Chlat1/831/Chrsp104S01180
MATAAAAVAAAQLARAAEACCSGSAPLNAARPHRPKPQQNHRRNAKKVVCEWAGYGYGNGGAWGKEQREGQRLAASFADFVRESRGRGWQQENREAGQRRGRDQDWRELPQVYVLLFNAGSNDEGIYVLQKDDETDNGPENVVLAFEAEEDAERFMGLLEAQLTMRPTVQSIAPDSLQTFCQESCYTVQVACEGELVYPPESTVEMSDWERVTRLRNGEFEVLSQEPAIYEEALIRVDAVQMVPEEDSLLGNVSEEAIFNARLRFETLMNWV